MKPTVDKDKCIGCGTCAATCGEVFEIGSDGKSHVKDGADCSKAACCDEAAENCPVNAIKL